MYILCCKHANLRPADAVGEGEEAETDRTEKINEIVSSVRQVVFLLRPPGDPPTRAIHPSVLRSTAPENTEFISLPPKRLTSR